MKTRHLLPQEIDIMKAGGNYAGDWNDIFVCDGFRPEAVRGCSFEGRILIGRIPEGFVGKDGLTLPYGIRNAVIRDCEIGDDCAISNVGYLGNYSIGRGSLLFNIGEMQCAALASFGVASRKLEIMNESGCRSILPFEGMLLSDAYLWAKYIDDDALLERLSSMTLSLAPEKGRGKCGEGCTIKNARVIRDTAIGAFCTIDSASEIENATLRSSREEPSLVGCNVILRDGIAGLGGRIVDGAIVCGFVTGDNSAIKNGARVMDTVLGDNGTIACCEVLNSLIFPSHEQHHNNSFLIASCIKGQSNIAAGATVGSNHNSRTPDNEVVAGRGFWPGLCSSVKHPSVFASYTLLSKGSYKYELNIPLPFSMVCNSDDGKSLQVLPAFWWLYDMYALARNAWKYNARDRRRTKSQHIEFDPFAPDTMQEVSRARRLLALWAAKSELAAKGDHTVDEDEQALVARGDRILESGEADTISVYAEGMERSSRPEVILKASKAYRAYGDMIVHYFFNCLFNRPEPSSPMALHAAPTGEKWINLGGQMMKEADVEGIRSDIRNGILDSWEEIHGRYDRLWERYPEDRLSHAVSLVCEMYSAREISAELYLTLLERERSNQEFIRSQVYLTRRKDYDNPFVKATYRNAAEMEKAYGPLEENSFVKKINGETEDNLAFLDSVRSRIQSLLNS